MIEATEREEREWREERESEEKYKHTHLTFGPDVIQLFDCIGASFSSILVNNMHI